VVKENDAKPGGVSGSASADKVAHLSAEQMWAADAASRMLGMQLLSVAPGASTLSMRVRADMINGWGLCHGGLISALADSAFAVACNTHGTITVGAGFDVTFLESARLDDQLVATARETAVRGRSGLYDVTVTRLVTTRRSWSSAGVAAASGAQIRLSVRHARGTPAI